jgi:hypothetical protein
MGDASYVAAILLLFGAATADAQITPPANPAGAYQKMSPGNQKVARALFEAQHAPTTTTTRTGAGKTTTASTTAAGAAAPKPLTLDQIAAMKRAGTGWEHVFRQMRTQGLIADKNIASVVTRYNQASRAQASRAPSASVATTAGTPGPARPSAALAGNRADESYGRHGNLR